MSETRRHEKGLTLVELTTVFVLATLVMAGLVSFYLNSQATWVGGSAEAQTQREMTLLVETMSDSIRASSQAVVTNYPDAAHQMVTVYNGSPPTPRYAFWWSPADSLIHRGTTPGGTDDGPIVTSPVTRFQLQANPQNTLVTLSILEARSAAGDLVRTATSFATYNR